MRTIILPLVWTIFLLSGCWLLPLSLTVEVHLPDLPPEWTGMELRYSLRYIGDDGNERWHRDIIPGKSASLVLARGWPSPVSAHPHGKGDVAPLSGFRCAGGVYPLDGGIDGPLVLSWTDGLLAELLFRLPREGRVSLNIPRLKEGIAKASFGNPWSLDETQLLRALMYQSIASSSVKAAPLFSWSPPPGKDGWWWGDSLFTDFQRNLPEELPEGSFWMYPGIHRLSAPEGGAYLLLEVEEWQVFEHPRKAAVDPLNRTP